MPSKQCYYQSDWERDDKYKHWVQRVPKDNKVAYCKCCHKTLQLGTMGEGALKTHARGTKHKGNVKQPAIYLTKKAVPKEKSSLASSSLLGSSSSAEKTKSQSVNLLELGIKNKVSMIAEIRWAITVAYTHQSDRMQDVISEVFPICFPEDHAAQKFGQKRTKTSYMIKCAIAPHFEECLLKEIAKSPWIVIIFDESLNKATQTCQMDVLVRFWDTLRNRVVTRYFTSEFMGHSTANDLLTHLLHAIEKIDAAVVFQVGMDGPSVNWKFFEKFLSHRLSQDLSGLIDFGSCSLHIVHGAFQSGCLKSGWKVKESLKGAFNLFKDSPARREDYAEICNTEEWPLKFCSHRWIEDLAVAERCIKLWPQLEKMVAHYKSFCKSRQPKCKAFGALKDASYDELFIAKLEFFSYIARMMEPYLTMHQCDKPMAPFVYDDLKRLVLKLLKVVVKTSVIETLTSQAKILAFDLSRSQNFLKPSNFNLGCATERTISRLKTLSLVEDKSVFNFNMECKEFVTVIIQKMIERSPVGKPIAKYVSIFDPVRLVDGSKEFLEKNMKLLLQEIVNRKIVPTHEADQALIEFGDFLGIVKRRKMLDILKDFKRVDDRLDELFFDKLNVGAFPALAKICKLIFCISHGQASVERGFSVNRYVSQHNMNEDTFVARRMIIDHLYSLNVKPAFFDITPDLVLAVDKARKNYDAYLKQVQGNKKAKDIEPAARSLEQNIKEKEKERIVMKRSADELQLKFDKVFEKAVEKSDMDLVAKSASLKRQIDEIKGNIDKVDESLKELKRQKIHD